MLEAGYRFLNNKAVSLEKLLAPHFESTVQQWILGDDIVVAHDTTEFSLREAMLAIAEMGGFIKKKNREPGWITLGRGFEKLLIFHEGWQAG
jgi:hypothetical protein